jgi:peptidoglycan hydrolase-like protein with peptidoglycan-binding domain
MATDHALAAIGRRRLRRLRKLVAEAAVPGVDVPLMLAIGERETGIRNIVGDAGHGRGWLQIDDRWHAEWLAAQRGCPSGKWTPVFASALPAGRVPGFTAATRRALALLASNAAHARQSGVPARDVLRVAVAGYNAGPGNAVAAYRSGDVDSRTANGDYSADVLRRRARIAGAMGGVGSVPPWPGRLLRRSPATIGHDVRRWQAQMRARGWAIPVTGTFDARSEEVCRTFQTEKGLQVDGTVGEETWHAAWTAALN